MPEGRIEATQKAFNIELKQFGTDNNIEVALENIDQQTDTSKPFLIGTMLQAPIEQADLGFTERMQGIYQVDINYQSHIGSTEINRMADALNQAFKVGSTLTRGDICVTITQFGLAPKIVDGGWFKTPISINWITHTARL